MENLRIYRIQDKYIRFLQSRDSRVQYNKGHRRPYVGIVLTVGQFQYFVPMESPKPSHAKLKRGYHYFLIDGGQLGLLGFNNMIPVHASAVIPFDINAEPDQKYADLLRRQVTYINRNKATIYERAQKTYFNRVNKNNKFLEQICCDFVVLEKACRQFDPYRK